MLKKVLRKIKSILFRTKLNKFGCVQYAHGVKSQEENVKLGLGSICRALVSIERDEAHLTLGNNSSIGAGTILSIATGIELGNNVLVSFNCIFTDNNGHSLDPKIRANDLGDYLAGRAKDWSNVETERIKIGDDSWIGAGVVILKGVEIGSNVIVGAGSVVTKSFPDNVVVSGNPAKIIRSNV